MGGLACHYMAWVLQNPFDVDFGCAVLDPKHNGFKLGHGQHDIGLGQVKPNTFSYKNNNIIIINIQIF